MNETRTWTIGTTVIGMLAVIERLYVTARQADAAAAEAAATAAQNAADAAATAAQNLAAKESYNALLEAFVECVK